LKSLFSQLISLPFIHGFEEETKYFHVASHDDSNKLSGFIKLFESNLDTIREFFTDKFWVDLFEELIKNDKVVGDSISFNEITELVQEKLESNSIIITDKSESYFNKENLKKGLLLTLDELVKYQVFLRGFNLKCKKCSSEFWYHINEVNETITCRGCFEHFDLGIEPEFKYKLNDLVKNNIFQPKTSRDGNLTVIRTLAEIKRRSIKSFMYIHQLNLYNDYSHKPFTDIDIVCISIILLY